MFFGVLFLFRRRLFVMSSRIFVDSCFISEGIMVFET